MKREELRIRNGSTDSEREKEIMRINTFNYVTNYVTNNGSYKM